MSKFKVQEKKPELQTTPRVERDLLDFETDDFNPRRDEPKTILQNIQSVPNHSLPSQPQISLVERKESNQRSSPNITQREPEKFETLRKAEKAYVGALKQIKTVDAFNQLAVYYNTKGKFSKSIDCCNEAILLDPNNEIARKNLLIFFKNQSSKINL